MRAQPEVNHAQFFIAVTLTREAAEDQHAAAVHDFFSPAGDIGQDAVQAEII